MPWRIQGRPRETAGDAGQGAPLRVHIVALLSRVYEGTTVAARNRGGPGSGWRAAERGPPPAVPSVESLAARDAGTPAA